MAATKPTILLLALATVWTAGGTVHAHSQETCEPVYRLYRNTAVEAPAVPGRYHIASFDSCVRAVGEREYNATMCEIARQLFQSQPGVKVTFWCEREGR